MIAKWNLHVQRHCTSKYQKLKAKRERVLHLCYFHELFISVLLTIIGNKTLSETDP